MLSLFQEASSLPRVKSLCKTSNTAMKMPPSSSFPWALILEHNAMWYGISLWPCISVPALPPKILPTCWEGRDRAPQPGGRDTGSLSSGHQAHPWAQSEGRLSLSQRVSPAQLEPKSESSSAGPKPGDRAGLWGLAARPASASRAQEHQLTPPGADLGSWLWAVGGGTEQGHCVLALLLRPWQKLSMWAISLFCLLFHHSLKNIYFSFIVKTCILTCIKGAFSFVIELP